mgnify:CR=1 FL=1
MLDMMTLVDRVDTLLAGHSIQGGNVYDNHGHLWKSYGTHEEASAAVNAYLAGLERGREIGRREGAASVRTAVKSALKL